MDFFIACHNREKINILDCLGASSGRLFFLPFLQAFGLFDIIFLALWVLI